MINPFLIAELIFKPQLWHKVQSGGGKISLISFLFSLEHINGFITYGLQKLSVFVGFSKTVNPNGLILNTAHSHRYSLLQRRKIKSILEAEIYLYSTDCLSDMKLVKILPTIDMSIRVTNGLRILSQSPYWIYQLTQLFDLGSGFFNSLAFVFPYILFWCFSVTLQEKLHWRAIFYDFLART